MATITQKQNKFVFPQSGTKIQDLVDSLRQVSEDPEIREVSVSIPDDCEKYGFAKGNHNLALLLHFLADMLEE